MITLIENAKTPSELKFNELATIENSGKKLTEAQQAEFKKAKAAISSRNSRAGLSSNAGAFSGLLKVEKDAEELCKKNILLQLNKYAPDFKTGAKWLQDLHKLVSEAK